MPLFLFDVLNDKIKTKEKFTDSKSVRVFKIEIKPNRWTNRNCIFPQFSRFSRHKHVPFSINYSLVLSKYEKIGAWTDDAKSVSELHIDVTAGT